MIDINDIKSITPAMVRREREHFGETLKINKLPFSSDGCAPSMEAIKKAINLACRDLMVRTLRRRPQVTKALGEAMISSLQPHLKDYFGKNSVHVTSQKNFNEWHHSVCEAAWKVLKDIYENAAYGKAQKIVNMTFKYLYCLDGADEDQYNNYFKYCHMPLDSYTLEWIKRVYKDENGKPLRAGKIPSWSNLEYSEELNDETSEFYSYNSFVSKIDAMFHDSNSAPAVTPFQAEFVIWPQIQFKLAAEAFLIELRSQGEELSPAEKSGIRKTRLSDNIKEIRRMLDTLPPKD